MRKWRISPSLLNFTVVMLLPVANATASTDEASPPASTNGQWLIRIDNKESDPKGIAKSVGAENIEPIEGVEGYYRIRFQEKSKQNPSSGVRAEISKKLKANKKILRFQEERKIALYPRNFNPPDPYFADQWHHENLGQSNGLQYADLQVRPVWDLGYDGSGVVVAVVDTGTEFNHPDLRDNWLTNYGENYLSNGSDPSPVQSTESHGTAVSGIISAVSNTRGGLGIAYKSKFVPLRLIGSGTEIDEGVIAQALSYQNRTVVDIYNNSWGPSDLNGVRYDPIDERYSVNEALESVEFLNNALADNVRTGRSGLGNIYVWAAGNGGLNGDNSNFDAYNSSPYTISVGAVGDDDVRAGYSEVGANLLVVAPSLGSGAGIFTTDNSGWTGYTSGDYFANFSGTSAAAPMVSGVVALMLEARPDLNWRDVQEILARTAVPVDLANKDWRQNGAGLWISHEYGFGRVDAHAAVELSRQWISRGQMLTVSRSQTIDRTLQQNQTSTGSVSINSNIEVQFVRVKAVMSHSDWGDLRIELESPAGTVRTLSAPHANNNRSGFPGAWAYLSTHNLGESANGTWKLHVTDAGASGVGSWTRWEIEIMGHSPSGNQSPVGDDLFQSAIDYPIEIDVLRGSNPLTDPDGDTIDILSVGNPRYGELVNVGNGTFRYMMGKNSSGVDSFSVLVGDGNGGSKRRIITISSPLPIAKDDIYPITAGKLLNLPVLSNDQDADGDQLRITSVSGVLSEYASIRDGGSIDFDPPAGLQGTVSLEYRITDDSDGNSRAKASLVVGENPRVALQFDGTDDHLFMGPDAGVSLNDNFTAEAMIYPESYGEYVSGFGRIYDRETFVFFLNGEYPHRYYNPRSLVAYLTTNDGQRYAINTGPNTISLNKWQHVAVTYASSGYPNTVRIYIDGENVPVFYPPDISANPPSRPISDNRIWSLYIGESDSGARAFRGRMSEFRIWNKVLGSNTIREQHDRKLTGNESGLQLYLPLTESFEPVAYSTGSYQGSLDIYEAQRVPWISGADGLSAFYAVLERADNGWSYNPILGWIAGEASLPWIYSNVHGWLYTGHEAYSNELKLYSPAGEWQWLFTSDILFPLYYRPSDGKWLWYSDGSGNPAWFYDFSLPAWLPL